MTNKYEKIFNEIKNHLNKAYSNYSKFSVASIAEKDNKKYYGFNIENASYSAGICAERVAIFNYANNQDWRLKNINKIDKLFIISNLKEFIIPCGICLQVMSEFMYDEALIISFSIDGKYKEFKYYDLNPYPVRKEFLFKK